ncbi:endoglucanase E-4-like [Liolophura sinensis]|uniref:endoglucanase E-4-like n=1 Tax=Liolophura sinensis TaxID=3198878 RepID=UPI0031596AB1
MLYPAVILVALVSSARGVDKIAVVNSWPGGFQGSFCVHANHAYHGWKALVIFSSAVENIETNGADILSLNTDKTEYVLRGKERDPNIARGQCVTVNFTATIAHGSTPTGTVTWLDKFDSTAKETLEVTQSQGKDAPADATPHGHGSTHEKYDYGDVLGKSILFYEAQRSGKLPPNNRVSWRGDSALKDGSDVGHDLTGGWYDAGDFVKFGLPMASTTTLLLWSLIQWPDAYKAAKQLDHMYDCVKWPLDYFIKCHTGPNEFYVQVGDGYIDHDYWGRPEQMTMKRPSFKVDAHHPGSDVAGETAAAMAAGYIAFKQRDSHYAGTLLAHARQLYKFATTYKGKYSTSVPKVVEFYESDGYIDELTWAGAWLYKATGEQKYLDEAQANYRLGASGPAWALDWDSKEAGAQLLLYEITKDTAYKNDITHFLRNWMPGGNVPYTPKGLAYRDKWGPNAYAANAALVALMAAENGLNVDKYRAWAEKQINYILGDAGHSFVVGFGNNPPVRPHHAASSCPNRPANCDWDSFDSHGPNPQILFGAVVGGPDKHDVYKDDRKDYVKNEVACDYNSGFQASVAGLKHLALIGELPREY